MKFEFVIRLPGLKDTQRYVLNIDINSKLPVITHDDDEDISFKLSSLFSLVMEFPSLTISIDFIDYLYAKNFLQTVEEWFNSLEASPLSKWAAWAKPRISRLAPYV